MTFAERTGFFRLYRNRSQGWLFGVCAGIADYFGVSLLAVRLLTFVGLVFFTLPTVLAYFAAAILLPSKPVDLYRGPEEEQFWQRARVAPRASLQELAARIRAADERLRAAEAYVTSRAFRLRRQFEDLEG
jgi:phage shock protein C